MQNDKTLILTFDSDDDNHQETVLYRFVFLKHKPCNGLEMKWHFGMELTGRYNGGNGVPKRTDEFKLRRVPNGQTEAYIPERPAQMITDGSMLPELVNNNIHFFL